MQEGREETEGGVGDRENGKLKVCKQGSVGRAPLEKDSFGGLLGTVEVYVLEDPKDDAMLVDRRIPGVVDIEQSGKLQE